MQSLLKDRIGNVWALNGGFALNLSPDWLGKVFVILPAGNDVPMNVRNDIAKAGKVDLVRHEVLTNDLFNG